MVNWEVAYHPCMTNHVIRSGGIGQGAHVRAVKCFPLSGRPHSFVQLMEYDSIFSKCFHHIYCLQHPIPTESCVLIKEMLHHLPGCHSRYHVGCPQGVNHHVILLQLSSVHLNRPTHTAGTSQTGTHTGGSTFMPSSSCVTLHKLVSNGSKI